MNESTIREIFNTMNAEKKKLVYKLVGQAGESLRMPTILLDYKAGVPDGNFGRELDQDLFDTFTEQQKNCTFIMAGCAILNRMGFDR